MAQFINIKKSERNFEEIRTIQDILEFIRTSFINRNLHIKFDLDKTVVRINDILEDNSILVVTDPDYIPVNNKLNVYGLLDKYIEFEMDVIDILGPGHFKCDIKKFKRAQNVRKEIRLQMSPEKVIADNFIISKHKIDVSSYSVPTGIKVILNQFESQNSKFSDIVKVDVFEENDPELESVKKSGKILYIEDVLSQDLLKTLNDEFLNLSETIDQEDFDKMMKSYNEKGYKSIIIAPVVYARESGGAISFAYVIVVSKTKKFTEEKVNELKTLIDQLIKRIKDANSILLQVKQEIVDLSKSGAKLKITDEDLKKYIIQSKGFVFDIIFKLQAPITFYTEVKTIYKDDQNNLFVGVIFAGHSSRKDEMKRYFSAINPMINEYKEKLSMDRKIKKS